MRIISAPRLKRLEANNKLKADRLKRKAHLARVSRRKKAQKMDELRSENDSLKDEIERLKKRNAMLQKENKRKHSQSTTTAIDSDITMESKIEDIGNTLQQRPSWMNDTLKHAENLRNTLHLREDQIASIERTINPDLVTLESHLNSGAMHVDRLKSDYAEKQRLQQRIHGKLSGILTQQQMMKLCRQYP